MKPARHGELKRRRYPRLNPTAETRLQRAATPERRANAEKVWRFLRGES